MHKPSKSSIKKREQVAPEAGTILIATPNMGSDEVFKRSIILIINHDNYEGTTGVMINKASNLTVNDALPEMEHHDQLFYGGNVNKKTISYLHQYSKLTDTLNFGNGICWGGNYEELKELEERGRAQFHKMIFMAGFVQWGAGQLQQEIEEDKWWSYRTDWDEIFGYNDDTLWGDMLIMREHVIGLLSHLPDFSTN